MARRDVVEVTCDRCGRVETQTSTETTKPDKYEVSVTFHGETVSFEDLCKRCRDAVKGYFTRLAKKPDEAKPKKDNVTSIDPSENPSPQKRRFLGGK